MSIRRFVDNGEIGLSLAELFLLDVVHDDVTVFVRFYYFKRVLHSQKTSIAFPNKLSSSFLLWSSCSHCASNAYN